MATKQRIKYEEAEVRALVSSALRGARQCPWCLRELSKERHHNLCLARKYMSFPPEEPQPYKPDEAVRVSAATVVWRITYKALDGNYRAVLCTGETSRDAYDHCTFRLPPYAECRFEVSRS